MPVVRRTWVYNPETRQMEELVRAPRVAADAPAVHGDFKPVNVGGIVIEDRGHLRRYLKANDLAPYDPSVAKRARENRARAVKKERLQSLVNSYEHERNKLRARSRFG